MKNIKTKILFGGFLVSALFMISCSNDGDATGESNLEVTSNVIGTTNLISPLIATQTVNEEDEGTYGFTVTLDKPQTKDIHIKISQISGTADSDDFTFDNDLIIKAYSTSASGSISILNDKTPEDDESFTLQIGDVNTSNATLAFKTVTFNIKNYLSPDLDLVFNYSKAFNLINTLTMEPIATSLCAIAYDMDFYILDSNFSDTGIYDAAAAGCPEKVTMDPARFPDGIYYVVYDVYDTGNINGGTNTTSDGLNQAYHDPFLIPISVDYIRPGGITSGNFVQESDFAPTSVKAAGYQNPNSNYVITIEVANGVYTLKNSLDAIIASGKMNVVTKINNAINHARINNPNK